MPSQLHQKLHFQPWVPLHPPRAGHGVDLSEYQLSEKPGRAAWRRLRVRPIRSLGEEREECSPHVSSNTSPQTGHQMKGQRPVRPRTVVLPDQPIPSNTLLVSPIQRKKLGSEKGYSDVSRDRNTTDAAGRNKVGVGGRIFLDVSQEPATCRLDQTHCSC